MRFMVNKKGLSILVEGKDKNKISFFVPFSKTSSKKDAVILWEEKKGKSDLLQERYIGQEGDYELGGVLVKVWEDPNQERLLYFLEDNIQRRLLYLGLYQSKVLPPEIFELGTEIDCLILRLSEPKGKGRLISSFAGEIEPRVVVVSSENKKGLKELQKELGWPVLEEGKSFSLKKGMGGTLSLVFLSP